MELLPLYIVLGVIGAAILFYFIPTFIISCIIYKILFVRDKPEKWGRHVSWDDEELRTMFAEGERWGEKYESSRKTLNIVSDNLHLVGEYFDFGFKKAVIIIPGRSESGTYSYYFAEPYRLSGYNVLAIDNRCHGLSEGKYNTLGLKEYRDIANWAKLLHDEHNVECIVIHGICIGSATGIHLLIQKDCPDCIKGIICEGTYTTFGAIFNKQLQRRNKPIFPHTIEVLGLIGLHAGKCLRKNSPINEVDKIKVPVCFLYSKKDTLAVPEKSIKIYEKVTAPKKLVWFDEGEHSHIRIHNTEKYDSSIQEFLKEYIK